MVKSSINFIQQDFDFFFFFCSISVLLHMVINFMPLCYIPGIFGKKLEKEHGHTYVAAKE